MSYGVILEFPSTVGVAEYNAVNAQLPFDVSTFDDGPDGLLSHTAGTLDGGGFVVTEVWESKEAQAAFMDSALGGAFAATGMPHPTRVVWFDVENSVHRH